MAADPESIEISLVTEAYNLAEGQAWERLQAAVAATAELAQSRPGVEVILTDPSSDPRVEQLAAGSQSLQYLRVPGLSYDGQKQAAALEARGRILVFLDGDCRPAGADWLEQITAPIRSGTALATGGTTVYDDHSVRGIACTIMDFGFLWDSPGGNLNCYASNNVAFLRDLWLQCPPPDVGLRCSCFFHAQLLRRRGTPVRHVAQALVIHQLPDVRKERLRRGYDTVAACWADPLQKETAWLRPRIENARLFGELELRRALRRMRTAPPETGLTAANFPDVQQEIVALRRIDLEGITQALIEGEQSGRNAAALRAHARALARHPAA